MALGQLLDDIRDYYVSRFIDVVNGHRADSDVVAHDAVRPDDRIFTDLYVLSNDRRWVYVCHCIGTCTSTKCRRSARR